MSYLTEYQKEVFARCTETLKAKNHDYSKGVDFKNFELVEYLGIADTQSGILTRMCDKVARLATLSKNEPKVAGEAFDDTAEDLINYLVILMAYRNRSTST